MANRKHHAMDTATRDRWRLLGRLLRARRMELGYTFRPAFAEARLPRTPQGNLSVRLLNAIENGERPGTYAPGRLEQFARAYEVTPGSVYAVLEGKADKLAPVPVIPGGQAGPVAELPALPPELPGWTTARLAADRPYYDSILGRLRLLRAQGNPDPSGGQLFPDSPADARDWDKYAEWEKQDRALLIADLQRRAVGRRAPGAESGAAGA